MKPLEEYETPEVDEWFEKDMHSLSPAKAKMKNLERRLAACREFIRDTAKTSSSSRIRREAMQVWTATAPKP